MEIKKRFIGLFCLFIAGVNYFSHAQIAISTPNAAELGKYTQVPVELFNGLPGISIPIHTIKNKDLEVPIVLNYHASGIKTEQHPTWTGLGWNLSCGGSITRIANGRLDETNKTDIQKEVGLGFINEEFGNFDASRYTAGSDWASMGGFGRFFGTGDFDFRFYLDGEPDEFLVNAPGISASFFFYRDQSGALKIKVKSRDGRHISVVSEYSSNFVVNFAQFDPEPENWPLHSSELTQTLNRPFFKFTLTTENGTKYTFGGNLDAIDFSTSPLTYRFTQPSAWYLTEMKSATGTWVKFDYKRQGNPIVVGSVISKTLSYLPNSSTGNCDGCADLNKGVFFTLQHPVYLSAINGSDGSSIRFKTSKSEDLPYNINSTYFSRKFSPLFTRAASAISVMMAQNFWVKLDEILINNQTKIKFNYLENANQRLKLTDVLFSEFNDTQISKYSLTYNARLLPRYNDKKSDNWGYYNNEFYETVSYETLYTYRSPDTALMKSEILTAITYPTGGTTFFEYEAHNYSKIATQFPLFTLQSSTGFAGGVRIRRITIKDGSSLSPAIIKEYTYLNEDNTSSGILSGIPVYAATGRSHVNYDIGSWDGLGYQRQKADYEQRFGAFSENYINMLGNTNGNHITYSRVIESIPGSGKIIKKYRNHDTFPDTLPVNLYTNIDDRTLTDKFTSKEIERGLLISSETFNEVGDPIQSETFEYNSSPSRFSDYVKSISRVIIPGVAGNPFIRMTATKIYTYFPYLQKKTVKTFGPLGAVSNGYTFSYFLPENLLKDETSVNSNGEVSKMSYFYPKDMPGSVYTEMVDKHIISPVVVKSTEVNDISTDYQLNQYGSPFAGIYVPVKGYRGTSSSVLEPLVSYDYHDDRGNILTLSKEKGPKTSYQWGYNKTYPVAAVKNASATEFYHQNFEDKITGFDSDLRLDSSKAHTGRFCGRITNGGFTPEGSSSVVRVPVNLNSPRKFTFSGWVYSDLSSADMNLIMVKPDLTVYTDQIQTTVKNKWVYLKKEFLVPGDVVSLYLRLDNNSFGNAWFDDLRIQPSDSDMTTYTYRPQVGMTSSIDNSGRITNYDYDSFQRLENIRDQNGNIIKNYKYNYKP